MSVSMTANFDFQVPTNYCEMGVEFGLVSKKYCENEA